MLINTFFIYFVFLIFEPALAVDRACPKDSSATIAELIIAPYDCQSQIIVSYKPEYQKVNFKRRKGCATQNSIRNLLDRNELKYNDLTKMDDHYNGQGTPLLVCLQELDGMLPKDSQPLVLVHVIQRNNKDNDSN